MPESVGAGLARRYFYEVFNEGDMQALEEICSPDFVFTLPTHEEPFRGVEGYKGLVSMLRGCFPDVHFAIEDQVDGGDRVLTRWTARGTHTGIPFPTVIGDVPAAGNRFVIEGMTWHEIVDGKLAVVTANEDGVGLIYQLGKVLFPGQPPATLIPAPADVNIAIAQRYFDEIINAGSMEAIDELMAPNFAFHIPTLPDPVRGPEGMKGFVTGLRGGFPDITFTPEYMVADGPRVAARYHMTGTHSGEFLGAPPSNKAVTDVGSDIFHISDGKFVNIFVAEDAVGLLVQMGVLG